MAKEIVLQRDSHTGDQVNFSDTHLAESQHQKCLARHLPSARSQVRLDRPVFSAKVAIGDLIYMSSVMAINILQERNTLLQRWRISICILKSSQVTSFYKLK